MSKKKHPKKFSPEFKLNVVLEGYASGNFSETAGRHGIHMTQMNNWKRQLVSEGSIIFEKKRNRQSEDQRMIEALQKTLGRLAFENDILKKTDALLNSGR